MKNSVKIKDALPYQSAPCSKPSNQNLMSELVESKVIKSSNNKPKRYKSWVVKALATSLALSLSFGFGAVDGGNQAQAASLGDLFGEAETSGGQNKFLKVDQAFSVQPNQNGNQVTINLDITPKHYLYKDKLSLKLPEGVTASPLKFSHATQTIDDPTFGKVEVFKQPQVTATTTLTNTTTAAINQDITITWQGCAEAGLCYPPQRETLSLSLPATTSKSAKKQSSDKAATNTNKANNSNKVEKATAASSKASATAESSSNSTKASPVSKTVAPKTAEAAKAPVTAGANTEQETNTSATEQNSRAEPEATDSTGIDSGSMIDENQDSVATDESLQAVGEDEDNRATAVQQRGSSVATNATSATSTLGSNTNGVVDEDPFGLAKHPWLALLLLFLAGLGLAFTPCVLPMLPIVSNIVARQHTPTAKKGLILSGSYALGVAIAYGLLGAVIAIFGQQLGIIGWLQNPIILLVFAAVFVLLALYMLEVISIPVPNSIRQKTQSLSQVGDKYLGSSFGSFIAGLLSALVVSPCVSAPLFGALLAVSTIGNPLLGFAALFMLGFGLSAPLMILGASQGNLMPKAGEWMTWVKQGFALLLFAVSLLLVERVLTSPIMLMLWAGWFMVVAVWAWTWSGRGQLFTKPLAILLGMWSAFTLVGAAAGSKDNWQPLAVFSQSNSNEVEAGAAVTAATANAENGVHSSDQHIYTIDELIPIIEQNQKVLVDVTAEWCVECRIMDKTLFTNRPAAMQQWQMVRLDVTESNEESARILSELNLFGPPALLYFVDGQLKVQQVGTIERDEFENTLNKL